jgi:hypothetical protein
MSNGAARTLLNFRLSWSSERFSVVAFFVGAGFRSFFQLHDVIK